MKRLLLPASALVLVLTACGAGAKPAPRVAEVGARVPSVHVIAARRKRAATREAAALLRQLVVPPEARRIPQPQSGGVLRQSGRGPLGEVADVHRFWRTRKPLEAVIAFLRAHRLHGFEHSIATWGSRKPHYLTMSSRSADRYLTVTSVGLRDRTVIRADVQVGWIYPRSPSERVPSGTNEIVIRAPKVSTNVTDHAKVAQIIRWFDALPISPPGIVVSCPLTRGTDITLSFRDARGARLARAKLPPFRAWLCSPIEVTIGGRSQKPLIDNARGKSFLRQLQDLLRAHLVATRR